MIPAARSPLARTVKPRRVPPRAAQHDEAIYVYGAWEETCQLAQFTDTPCRGRLERAHWIKQQVIRREVLSKLDSDEDPTLVLWDRRVWTIGCTFHHHALDSSRKLRVPRGSIPQACEEYAAEHGIEWWLSRTYGERGDVAA